MSLEKLSEGSAELREKVLQTLKESNHPLSVLQIQKRSGIGHWLSTKNILLELMLQGKVMMKRLGKARLFMLKEGGEAVR